LGIFLVYTNNPYSTTISGIIINLYNVLLVICIKEYIRYVLINQNMRQKKIVHYILIFLISDINLLSLLGVKFKLESFTILFAKELLVPIMINLLMMYLSFVSTYKTIFVIRIILTIPSLIFLVVPDYEWFVIIVLNILYCLSTYLILQYSIDKSRKDMPSRLIISLNPKRWITSLVIILFAIAFIAGLFPLSPVVILSGSMEPSIRPGDLVIIRRCGIDEIKIGDIIEYNVDEYNVIHRVVDINQKSGKINLVTKGDANESIDKIPVTNEVVVGRVEYIVPYIGYHSYFLRRLVNNNRVNIEQGG